ncbi:hypothetical protein CSW36_07205 [Thermus scotoductus]|nr:hypothetical protein CSW36_07205 [Thermus scotoductus]
MDATRTVVVHTNDGIGGDIVAMVGDGGLHGLNASGQSPLSLTPARNPEGRTPERGCFPGTVLGAA